MKFTPELIDLITSERGPLVNNCNELALEYDSIRFTFEYDSQPDTVVGVNIHYQWHGKTILIDNHQLLACNSITIAGLGGIIPLEIK